MFAGNKSLDSAMRETQGAVTGKAKEGALCRQPPCLQVHLVGQHVTMCPLAAVKGQVRGVINENKVR